MRFFLKITVAAFLLIVLVSIATTAEQGSNVNTTAVSGFSGSAVTVNLESPLALTGIGTRENGDKPCQVTYSFRNLNSGSGQAGRDTNLTCVSGNSSSRKDAILGDNFYVYSVQVCTTNVNNTARSRVKGIRIWGARVNPDNSNVRRTQTQQSFERTNCPNDGWRNRVRCPKNKVAVGLELHEGERGLSGVALICANVVQ